MIAGSLLVSDLVKVCVFTFYFPSSTDEELQWDEDDSDDEHSWADLARSYTRQLRKSYNKQRRTQQRRRDDEDMDSDDTETGTVGASDADWEMEDTETEKESDDGGRQYWMWYRENIYWVTNTQFVRIILIRCNRNKAHFTS